MVIINNTLCQLLKFINAYLSLPQKPPPHRGANFELQRFHQKNSSTNSDRLPGRQTEIALSDSRHIPLLPHQLAGRLLRSDASDIAARQTITTPVGVYRDRYPPLQKYYDY
jgi:hypothetical protein